MLLVPALMRAGRPRAEAVAAERAASAAWVLEAASVEQRLPELPTLHPERTVDPGRSRSWLGCNRRPGGHP